LESGVVTTDRNSNPRVFNAPRFQVDAGGDARDQAAVENDPEKLMVLVKEIIRMLDEKERRLKYRNSDTQTEER
jgi:hypothetical protein